MLALLPIASKILAGPLSSIIGGVVNSLGGVANNAINTAGGVANNGINNIFGFANNLVNKLFGGQKPGGLRPPFQFPNPFTLPQQAFTNLTGAVQNLTGAVNGMQQNFGKILDLLKNVLGGQQQGGFPGFPGGINPGGPFFPQPVPSFPTPAPWGPGSGHVGGSRGTSLDRTISNVGNKAQSLMDQAQQLAASDNPADQMKAQRMMQQAQRMMEFMSNMIKIIGDMQKNAIQNMR